MADSWEDEDFEVPSLLTKPAAAPASSYEEEEDTLQQEQEQLKPAAPSAAQIEAANKKAQQEDLALANHLKSVALENETPEQKRLRERRQVEDADIAIAGELFGKAAGPLESNKGSSSGLGGISLKTKQEHINFAILCHKKLSDSTPLNVGFYYKSLTDKVKDIIPAETLDDLIATLTKVREDKKKTEAKKGVTKKSKKELAQATARHAEIFGDTEETVDKYDHYTGMEDDFM